MSTITRVGAKSVARVLGMMYLILGGLFGLVFLILSLFPTLAGEPAIPVQEALIMLIIFSLGYGIIGWLGGYASAWLYNAIAKRFGGIEFELDDTTT